MASGRPFTAAFPAMGSFCEVTVVGGSAGLLALARRRVDELEKRWSRFLPASELCSMNASAGDGHPFALTTDTYLLVEHGVAAWRWTSGRFDPTVLKAMIDAGYDAPFVTVRARMSSPPRRTVGGAPGCDGIQLDPVARTVMLPHGVGIDPGGYGKGLAADLVVEALLDAGAAGACVSMGGDVRASAEPPDGGWRIGIANPFVEGDLVTVVVLEDHGLATSDRLVRRWDGAEGERARTHLLDPRSGRFADGLVSASVIAGQAWWAEVLAKVAMVERAATRTVIPLLGGEGLYVEPDGSVSTGAGFARFDGRAPVG